MTTLIRQLDDHPAIKTSLDRLWQVVGGVSVRTKILGIVLALTIGLGLSITWQVRSLMSFALIEELERLGYSVIGDLAFRSTDPLTRNDIAALNQLLRETMLNHPDARYAFLVDANNQVIAHTFEADVPPDLLNLDSTKSVEFDHHPNTTGPDGLSHHLHYENDEGGIHDFAEPVSGSDRVVVRLGLVDTRLQTTIDRTTRQMLLTTVLVGVAGVIAASLLTWLLTRPILDLVTTTRRLRQGNLAVRAPHWADDEIGALADAFNEMVADLEVSYQLVAEKEAARSRLLAQLIDAQEEERKRIARELHDGVGQALTSILVSLKVVDQLEKMPSIQAKLAELRQIASETLTEVRLLSRQLRPSALDDLGLAAAMERFVGEFSSRYPDLAVDLHCNLPERLPPVVETSLYRIVQEAMTNAARHSQATALSVLLSRRDGTVQAIVEDNGHGFDPAAARRDGSSVGLHSMAERTELLGGHLEIESSAEGTTVYVEIPI
jgi:signal transduction histidine kinase